MPVSAKELHSWDWHRSRSSQSPAETQPATDTCSNTRLALPNQMSQCTQECTMLNIRALSEEQRYSRRRSIEDPDPEMKKCGRCADCKMTCIRAYNSLRLEDSSPLAGEGRKRTRLLKDVQRCSTCGPTLSTQEMGSIACEVKVSSMS